MSRTITAVGIEKIGRRLADSIDHAAYTLNGEPKTVEPFRRLVSADEVKIYIYFDDTVTGTSLLWPGHNHRYSSISPVSSLSITNKSVKLNSV